MAHPIPPEASNEQLAGVYEILKQHEQALVELLADVKALRNLLREILPPGQLALFEQERHNAIHDLGSAFATSQNLAQYDEIIAKLRGK